FEPRFEIGMAKAGEFGERTTFSSSRRSGVSRLPAGPAPGKPPPTQPNARSPPTASTSRIQHQRLPAPAVNSRSPRPDPPTGTHQTECGSQLPTGHRKTHGHQYPLFDLSARSNDQTQAQRRVAPNAHRPTD